VPGADGVEAEPAGTVEHGGELDPLVAAHARVGGAAGGVLSDEVVDDIAGEALGDVPDIEGDAEHVSRAPRIPRVLQRAAAARALAVGRG
jgi:hypothetical protein